MVFKKSDIPSLYKKLLKKHDIPLLHKKLLKLIPTKWTGVYVLKDHLGRVVYVGQTWEGIRGRLCYHFNRSDPLAKHQIDPGEIAYVEVWVFGTKAEGSANAFALNLLERYVFDKYNSQHPLVNTVVLKPPTCTILDLPQPQLFQILSDEAIADFGHPQIWRYTKKAQLRRMNWYMNNCNNDNENLNRSFRVIRKRYREIVRMEEDLLKSAAESADIPLVQVTSI